MEPEGIIPLSLATKESSIILAGDDKQIGAIVQSESGN
jgi:hypothetical protein